MGIELPYGMAFLPTAIAWLVSGIIAEVLVVYGRIRDTPINAVPVIAAGIVFGKVWALVAEEGTKVIFLAIWMVCFFGALIFIMVYSIQTDAKIRSGGTQVQGNVQTPVVWTPPVTARPPPVCTSKARQSVMYHATLNVDDAQDIFRYRRFKVGPSIPLGFYVSPDYYEIAVEYGKGSGAVVEFSVGPNVLLREKGQGMGYFYFHTPNADVGEYINLPNGMVPAKVWDCKSNLLNN